MRSAWLAVALALAASPARVHAFCGLYVSGAGGELYNDTTTLVVMRWEDTTILSMQSDYRGPPEDFALVVPVPGALAEGQVRTLPRALLAQVDRLAAPRLVEYWEEDPCAPEPERAAPGPREAADPTARGLGVTVEGELSVAEYEIAILSAEASAGLETWLRDNDYRVPQGAAEALAPYVEAGMKFFVARVDVDRVTFEAGGRAVLTPLRVHYRAERLVLPLQFGLASSSGTQDVVVHVLAPGRRFEAASHPNATIATNLDVDDAVRERFGAFYAALFDATVERHPGAVVTEHAWPASRCDPCMGDVRGLGARELYLLGADVLGAPDPDVRPSPRAPRGRPEVLEADWVLTRLHHRYASDALREDLALRPARPIEGGREVRDDEGRLAIDARPGATNAFQARYVIRHPWEGPIPCAHPTRDRWGGPPSFPSGAQAPVADASDRVAARAPDDEELDLRALLRVPVPALGLRPLEPIADVPPPPPAAPRDGCGCRAAPATRPPAGLALALLLLATRRR
ncbi:MAG: DUF2330 domain-containing protein [Sandaracinaceae bacterium]|nr:DUF2330 domain-containing protein [Sandaracinaceae bacterium]